MNNFLMKMLAALVLVLAAAGETHGIPYFARSNNLSCTDCHSIPPKLNARGESFLARGYRVLTDRELMDAVAGSVWITGRFESRDSGGADDEKSYVPKVELISGGPLGDLPASYFVEWRIVSLDLRPDGSLRDRGGRFEDAFVNWTLGESWELRAGQFRALSQYDVSLRLSVSEPLIFSRGLPGKPAAANRRRALRYFSPSGRSPGFALEHRSIAGQRPSDGLFHTVTLPFPGELSLPLSSEARREAGFELEGRPKGVFLETFYRRRLNSLGAHAFVGDDRWLVNGVGRMNTGKFFATAGAGLENTSQTRTRPRYSLELEYVETEWRPWLRPGIGFRAEYLSRANRDPAYIPYIMAAGPNTRYTLLLQVEARFQGGSKTVFVDLSTVF